MEPTEDFIEVMCEHCNGTGRIDLEPPIDKINDIGDDPYEFTESTEGYEARQNWAERYDELNGAPEGPWDI
jgi:hypothetical protein